MPTIPSNAGATTSSVVPSNNIASGEITDTVSTGVSRSGLGQLLRVLDHVVDAAGHEERLLRQVVELARHEALERHDRLHELHVLADDARELLRHRERLRHEALHAARTRHHLLVLFRQLVHAEDRDDVLQLLVALQNALHLGGHLVVAIADELRVENSRRRSMWIDGGIDAE